MNDDGAEYYNSGLLKIDLKDNKWKILASSIRRPPLTPLDGIKDYEIRGIFKNEGKLFLPVRLNNRKYDIYQYDIALDRLHMCESLSAFQNLKILPFGRQHDDALKLSSKFLALRIPKRLLTSEMKNIDSVRNRTTHNEAFLYAIPTGVFFFFISSDEKPFFKFYPNGKTPTFIPLRFKCAFEKFVATSGNSSKHRWISLSGNHAGLATGPSTKKHVVFYQIHDNLFWYADHASLANELVKKAGIKTVNDTEGEK